MASFGPKHKVSLCQKHTFVNVFMNYFIQFDNKDERNLFFFSCEVNIVYRELLIDSMNEQTSYKEYLDQVHNKYLELLKLLRSFETQNVAFPMQNLKV